MPFVVDCDHSCPVNENALSLPQHAEWPVVSCVSARPPAALCTLTTRGSGSPTVRPAVHGGNDVVSPRHSSNVCIWRRRRKRRGMSRSVLPVRHSKTSSACPPPARSPSYVVQHGRVTCCAARQCNMFVVQHDSATFVPARHHDQDQILPWKPSKPVFSRTPFGHCIVDTAPHSHTRPGHIYKFNTRALFHACPFPSLAGGGSPRLRASLGGGDSGSSAAAIALDTATTCV